MRVYLTLFLISLLISCSDSQTFDLVIRNVNVIDVENDKVISNQTVGIKGDSIAYLGDDHSVKAIKSVDGNGKFLMPGLWDNHVHFRGGKSLIDENKDFLSLFIEYGITTVRDAGGDITPSLLQWRKEIANGALIGPQIFTSGPKLDGENPSWDGSIKVTRSEHVTTALDSLELIGADFVKMYDGSLTKEMFYEIIKQAENRDLKSTGHMPLTANLLEAASFGLDGNEHLYYLAKACSPLGDSLGDAGAGYGMMSTIAKTYDDKLADSVFSVLAEKDFYATPTLYIGRVLREVLDVDHTQDSVLSRMGSGIVETYQGRVEGAKRARERGSNMRNDLEKVFKGMVKPMHDKGIILMAGSDCGAFNSYVYPGASLHGELIELVNAGLTPAEALATSVINGPRFFDLENQYGSVELGKKADLIILNVNPLEQIDFSREIESVVSRGTVLK